MKSLRSTKGADLGQGSVGKLLFSLSLPTITSQIVNMLYNMVDRIYIGHIQPADTVGALALTGVGVCFPIIMLISAFAALMGMGGVQTARDVIEMMLAGATAVQIGAANLTNPCVCKEIIEQLPIEMEKLGISSLKDIIGGAH